MTQQNQRIRVENLRNRAEAEFNIRPGTNEEAALRFLASHAEWAYPPAAIAAETTVPQESVTKTMSRLRDKGAVEVNDGYYFVPEDRLKTVRGLLGDLHHIDQMPLEDDYVPVHPTDDDADDGDEDEGTAVGGQSATVDDYEPDSDDEIEALLNSPDGAE